MRTIPQKKRESGIFQEVWRAYNDVLEYLREISPLQSGNLGIKVDRTSNGTLFKLDAGLRASTGTIKRFRLVTVENDYYVCNEFTGEGDEVGSESINVAKQHELRHTGWHGETVVYSFPSFPNSPGQLSVTYTFIGSDYRTASFTDSRGAVTEHQMIHPILIANQTVILAARTINGTGVDDADEWIEVGPRAWAKVADVIT